MNRLRDRIKAETGKYQQKLFGSSESAAEAQPNNTSVSQTQQQHIDVQKLHFEALPRPQYEPQSSQNEIKIRNVTEMGSVHSQTTTVKRDLGFAGQIGSYVLLSYGDTIYSKPCPPHLNLSYPDNLTYDDGVFRGMTSNSVAIATHDPLSVIDPPATLNSQHYPDQFVKVNDAWGEEMATHAVGITNVVETNAQTSEGIVFTLLNHRPGGVNHILGAGIATVKITLDHNNTPIPHATRTSRFMWDGECEPWWGDVGAVRDADHIYVYGHKKDNPWVYLARARVEDVLKIECYEYWHGRARGWSRDRLTGDAVGEEQSVFWQVNQGQVVWNPHFGMYLFLYCNNFWSSQIILRAAPKPEGPWGPEIEVIKIKPITEGATIYSATPQVQYDTSGKTLVVGYTNHPNVVQMVKIEFET